MKCTTQAEKLLMRATALKINNAGVDAQSLLFHALAELIGFTNIVLTQTHIQAFK